MMTEVEWTILLRAGLAGLIGFVIGRARQYLGDPVRSRAVAMAAATAAALIAMTEAYYPEETARVVAGLITGIGVLGAGAILRSSTGEVHGHTTAAGLWAMSAIGMAIGSGHELLGVLLAGVLYTIIAVSEWPILTRLKQLRAQLQGEADGSQPGQPAPESQAPDDPPAAK